ncbi:MAG: acyltransferase family protein [Clostridium sp.]|nr:acyltransferase family protein [Clostridium sp.]
MKTEHQRHRNQTLDITKGVLILLVVYGHAIQYSLGPLWLDSLGFFEDPVFRTIYSFHMPLFMLISGYLFGFSNLRPWRQVVTGRLLSIGIPFITYCTVMYLMHVAAHFDSLSAIVAGYPKAFDNYMWFLKSVLANCLIVATVTRLARGRHEWVGTCFLILLFLVSFIVRDRTVMAVYKFMYPYFLTGYFICRYGGRLTGRCLCRRGVLLGLTLFFIAGVCFFTRDIYVYTTGYTVIRNHAFHGEQLVIDCIRFVIGGVGCVWFLAVMMRLSSLLPSRWIDRLSVVGRYTLAIYGLQSVLLEPIRYGMDRWNINLPHNHLTPLLVSVAILLVCALCIRVARCWRPTRILLLGCR